jgi:predicted lipase
LNKQLTQTINAAFDGTDFSAVNAVAYVTNNLTDSAVLVTMEGTTTVLTFRSTKTVVNVLFDFWAWPLAPYLGMKFHPGFLVTWCALKDDLCQVLRTMNNKSIEVRGHSLGASVAAIAARALKLEGYNVTKAQLLGCPRFGSRAAVKSLYQLVPEVSSWLNGNDYIWWVTPFLSAPKATRIGVRKWWKLFSFNDHNVWDTKTSQGYETSLSQVQE